MLDLVIIGNLLKEKIIFPDGKEIGPVLGSPAAYASVAAANLGLNTGLVTQIGKDMPEELLKVFKETGVDTEGIRISDNTTTNLLIYEKSGKKRLKFLKKAEDISFEDIPEKYLDANFFLIAPIDCEVHESLIKSLYQKGKRLSMELSGFGGASSSKNRKTKREKIEFLKRITQYFEIVKGGKEDYQCLFSSPLMGKGRGEGEEREIAKKFLEWGAKVSIITLGEEGALVMNREKPFRIPVFPTEVVDCTGAGDVWHAGFLYKYIKEEQRASKVATCRGRINPTRGLDESS
ncbi:MAG: carbohydrate kinase family protein, partial [Candidatus Omnitrophica bacterium]|nr:carbohydrate kinase family protein [Candidatus Omnitrophota bacterium]